MTESSPEKDFDRELDVKAGRLKRAAIDAFMADSWVYYIDEAKDVYVDRLSGHTITRPGKDGSGGGDWTAGDKFDWTGLQQRAEQRYYNESEDKDWKSLFDSIRSVIDDHLKPWRGLPVGTGFQPQIRTMERVAGRLCVDEGAAAGPIRRKLESIDLHLDEMSGGIIATFTSDFLVPLSDTISAHHDLAVVLGEAVSAERKIWEMTQESVLAIVAEATAAFEEFAKLEEQGPGAATVLKVVAAAVGGALAFATAPASVPVAALAATTGIFATLSAAADSQEKAKEQADADRKDKEAKALLKPADPSFEALMKGFEQCLKQLDDSVYAEEKAVADNLKAALGKITGSDTRGAFDLAAPLRGVDDGSDLHKEEGRAIIHDRSKVNDITDKYMPAIAGVLRDLYDHELHDAFGAGAFDHDGDIGYGHDGCYREWADLLDLHRRLVGDLAWEVKNGAKTLDLAIDDMEGTDSDASDALKRHARKIEDGSPHDTRSPEEIRDEARKYGLV